MHIDTTFLRRCIDTLERAFEELARCEPEDIAYDIFRAACVKDKTAHDYGKDFAEATLRLLPGFITDAWALASAIEQAGDG